MKYQGRVIALAVSVLAMLAATATHAQPDKPRQKKPSLSLKANPSVSFAPVRIVLVADVKGGSDDYEDFYCASVAWDWGDGTESQKSTDCDPYEAGKSQIQRHFTIDHRYELAGEYRIVFKLKRGDKVVGAASAMVRVRPGLRDIGE
jgi:hypothetical protein